MFDITQDVTPTPQRQDLKREKKHSSTIVQRRTVKIALAPPLLSQEALLPLGCFDAASSSSSSVQELELEQHQIGS